MEYLDYLEFNTLTVIGVGRGSEIFLHKKIDGNKIFHSSEILIGDIPVNIDYIIHDHDNIYRLINSNQTIVVRLD